MKTFRINVYSDSGYDIWAGLMEAEDHQQAIIDILTYIFDGSSVSTEDEEFEGRSEWYVDDYRGEEFYVAVDCKEIWDE